MNTQDVLDVGKKRIAAMNGHIFDVLSLTKPVSRNAALNMTKVISKLSPLLGNLIEINLVEILNKEPAFNGKGEWKRQDPGFPDVIFSGIIPTPGFEVKAWYPLATEVTGRFRDSQNHFTNDNTRVALVAWLPEHLVWGRPRILDVCVTTAKSIAESRDGHYHKPPDYLVIEPEDTKARTSNLQQTNTAGYKFQGTKEQFAEAQKLVDDWGASGREYKPTSDYQTRLRQLMGKFKYRLDTNYAKMDRIAHTGLEEFKTRICGTEIHGMTVKQWSALFGSGKDSAITKALEDHLKIKEEEPTELVR